MIRQYFRLKLLQSSPLHLSNGDHDLTDSDLIKDSRGLPFIPGSGLAGSLRSLLDEKDGKTLFGWLNGDEQQASRVLVSDGVLPAGTKAADIHLIHRDGVGLDIFRGTALETAKYDFEAVETDRPYTAVVEWSGEEGDPSSELLRKLVASIAGEGLHLGGKTTRGYGAMRVTAEERSFRFPQDLQVWLDFSPFTCETGWTPVAKGETIFAGKEYCLDFEIQGAVCVRVYSTNVGKADFQPMKNSAGLPVIPGTSWAGAFRHRMQELAAELGCSDEEKASVDALFGKEKKEIKKSRIRFSQSLIQGGKGYELTRNALDRFTAGPAMSALYTAGYWQGGKGQLVIRVEKDAAGPFLEQLLKAAIQDLAFGLMTVGGGASVGLGRVYVTRLTVNGQEEHLDTEVIAHV